MKALKMLACVVLLSAGLTGCAGLGLGFKAGAGDGFGGGPPNPPAQGSKPLVEYGAEFLAYLLAYGVGSLGKGILRQKLAVKVAESENKT